MADGKARFERLLAERGVDADVDRPDAGSLVDAMLEFYGTVRAEDAAALDEDGDMVLFQWGTGQHGGRRYFEFDLTRQWIEDGAADDDRIWQLHATLLFEPMVETDRLASGNRWCFRPDEADSFKKHIAGASAMAFASGHEPARFSLMLERVS